MHRGARKTPLACGHFNSKSPCGFSSSLRKIPSTAARAKIPVSVYWACQGQQVLKASFAASASMLAGSALAAKPEQMRYWDNHAGFGYVGPKDVDLLDHWRSAGVNYLSINVGYDPVPWNTTIRAIADYTKGIEARSDMVLCATLSQVLAATVVELGSGAGANLRYLPRGIRLIAIEPNVRMHPALRRRAVERGVELDLRGLRGEELDIPTGSVDLVFSSLVLCSVERPEQVIAEVRRILKPGGRFACVEHVVAPEGSPTHAIQQLIRRPWKWLFEGCELCRDTAATLRSSGFSRVDVQSLVLPTIFIPIRHQIAAMCVN